MDEPRNIPTVDLSTFTLNPYQSHSRQELNYTESKKIKSDTIALSDSKIDELSSYQRIAHLVSCNILHVTYAFIDFCVMRLARLETPRGNVDSSTVPTYNLQINVDDILHFIGMLCASLLFSSWMQAFTGPLVIMICVVIGSVSRKIVGSHRPTPNESVLSGEVPPAKVKPTSNDGPRECTIRNLQNRHPGATFAECKRFYTAVKYNEEAASKRIEDFLKWRSDCGLKTTAEAVGSTSPEGSAMEKDRHIRVFDQTFAEKDEQDWNVSSKLAISIITKSHVPESVAKLPQIICSYEEYRDDDVVRAEMRAMQCKTSTQSSPLPRCKVGTRILHILPARIDLTTATAQTYSLAVALYLDRRLSRVTTERITVFCDVRGGRGWANPTAWSTLPFIRSTALLLGSNYPERLEKLVLFPMPSSASWVWSAAQKCLDPNTASKVVVIVSGAGGSVQEKLLEFIDEGSLNVLEKRRRCFFAAEPPIQSPIQEVSVEACLCGKQ